MQDGQNASFSVFEVEWISATLRHSQNISVLCLVQNAFCKSKQFLTPSTKKDIWYIGCGLGISFEVIE
jgi:hypothetical protein